MWKTEKFFTFPTNCELGELASFKMDRLTLKEANDMIKYLINISSKPLEETIKEFEV